MALQQSIELIEIYIKQLFNGINKDNYCAATIIWLGVINGLDKNQENRAETMFGHTYISAKIALFCR
jgi:hypothetical protein